MLQIFTVRNEGNVFTPVCHSVHGGCLADTPWADTALADTPWADNRPPPDRHPTPRQTVTAVDGTHPTGMHSCYRCGVSISVRHKMATERGFFNEFQ